MNRKHLLALISGMMLASSGSVMAGGDVELENGMDAARDGYYNYAASVFGQHADKGDGDAQFNMALMYHSGLGVARDERHAVELYEKAAENGHEMATAYLAAGYAEGWFGLERDAEKAQYWADRLPQTTVSNDFEKPVAKGERKFGWE